MNSKKGISSIIAISLLLVISVTTVVSFQTWINTYTSNLENKIESSDSSTNGINIKYISKSDTETYLHIYNNKQLNIAVNEIIINGTSCSLTGSDVLTKNEITKIPVSCIIDNGKEVNILILTSLGLIQETKFVN